MEQKFSLAYAYAAIELHVSRFRGMYISLLLAIVVLGAGLWFALFSAPPSFPAGTIIEVEEGQSLPAIAAQLQEEHLVRSDVLFIAVARLTRQDKTIQAGKYLFHEPLGMWYLVDRLSHGISGIELVRVYLPEGLTALQMAEKLSVALPGFNKEEFLNKSLALEGYLFPDTYFFMPDATVDEVIERLYANFEAHRADIDKEIILFDRPLIDIVIMASLLEREARSLEEKQMIAGILWNRMEEGMPLQVDAVFGYIKQTETYSPSFSDLEIDSPYNTYLYKGLPPGPIANPGLDSLLAAVTPTKTSALYYLTGRDGLMHYAKTFAEHKTNRARYLD